MLWVTLLLAAAPAPTARWAYAVEGQYCPSAETVESLIVGRLGRSLFVRQSEREISIRINTVANRYQANVVFSEPNSTPTRRELTSSSCEQLVEALVLTIAFALDNGVFDRAPLVALPNSLRETGPTTVRPHVTLGLYAWLSVSASLGIAPQVSGGVRLGAKMQWSTGWGSASRGGVTSLPRFSRTSADTPSPLE
jgi:hypothetical protein